MASYRPRTTENRDESTRVPPVPDPPSMSKEPRNYAEPNTFPSGKWTNVGSLPSSGRLPRTSSESTSRIPQPRPSGLPRSTSSSSSSARLGYIASTRPAPVFAAKSPPLQSLPVAPPPAPRPQIDSYGPLLQPNIYPGQYHQTQSPIDMEDDTVLGIVMPEKSSTYPPTNLPPRLIPELQALAASSNRPANVASSSISTISSPSTQFTTSSSPWSASTTATTPISWTSASPHIMQAATSANKRSHTVPMPSNVKPRTPKLPVLTEGNPSASTSRTTLVSDSGRGTRKLRKANVPDPPPPPRSTSLRRARSRSNSAATTGSEKHSAPEISIPRFPVPPISSSAPILQRESDSKTEFEGSSHTSQGHSRLQEALNSPTRLDTTTSILRPPTETIPTDFDHPRPRQLLEPLPVVKTHHRRFPSLSRRHVREPSTSEPETEKPSARSRLAKFSKLTLFGKSKTSPETEKKAQKLQSRKGPAAGTGHEGYGKFGLRGRKQSVGSSTAATDSETSISSVSRKPIDRRQSRISSTSQEQSDLDEWASTRMKPIVMVGGSHRARADPFPIMPKNAHTSDVSLVTVSSTDSYPAHRAFVPPRRERFPPEDEFDRPSLATRRSQKFANTDEEFRIPQPIETRDLSATPCLDSRNTTQSSEVPTPASAMYRSGPDLLDKQRSKSRKLKWNIFRRKDSISEAEELNRSAVITTGLSVDVAPAPLHRPVPYYAIIGSESEVDNAATIGQYLREATESPEKEDELISVGFSDNEVTEDPYVHRESILLPSAPVRRARRPSETDLQGQPITVSATPVPPIARQEPLPLRRQPRLAQVGRIPKVVSTRQQTQPGVWVPEESPSVSSQSFQIRPSTENLPRLRTGQSPPLASGSSGPSNNTNIFALSGRQVQNRPGDHEFLQYAAVRDSDFTTSSESTGIISIAGPALSQVPSMTAQPLEHLHHEDEVWNEYNDFMDDIMSPASHRASPRKQTKSTKFQTENATPRTRPSKDTFKQQGLAIISPPMPAAGPSRQFLDTPPVMLSNVSSLQDLEAASSDEIRLRRSRIAAALHASYAPSSPFSMREFIDEYGSRGSGKYSERFSESSAPPLTPTHASIPPPRTASKAGEYENASHLEDIERTRNPTKHSDRSYASLMVSRWLSFGRVLFSPAHQEIADTPEKRVLVIDGLGSEDWSIYCAVTYQKERAYVHDLKERRQGRPKTKPPQAVETAPPNHRRSEVASFNDKFPFPPGFFCAIVIRFPPAMPDSKLKNIVAECRRVLAPGGYLELMVLDLDIVNMGVQTRRAIKNLKIKMTAADRTVSLKPIIDNVQTVLGSNGFSNLSRCIVGVPVVGKPAGSLDSSSESRSSTGSTGVQPRRASAGPRPYGPLGGQANFSLNDLVADHSENADAKIGKMVSRTARSWWQHCFEAGIMSSDRAKSIFASKEVLHECKVRAASFKLLIAYTQKPKAEERRRTMSEPLVPTLATAGVSSTRAQR